MSRSGLFGAEVGVAGHRLDVVVAKNEHRFLHVNFGTSGEAGGRVVPQVVKAQSYDADDLAGAPEGGSDPGW